LRDDANSYVTSPIIQGMEHYTVADLMNSTNHTWQWDTIKAYSIAEIEEKFQR
jgi:hypothetical protein